MKCIGARDGIDRALIRQYANVQTCNFDDVKINSEDMWDKINMLAMRNKTYISLRK